ncbi:LysR substrate-binding domain-containing protein [Methylicorpusculum sp.]|uniref:LysR substrate-binding domain-containing protein n=1 Tax=Methylicorpusculum sp. TaxID=2713644 RepID=UPI003520BD15
MALPGKRHALRAQIDALCESAEIKPRQRAKLDDMALLHLIAPDSNWLTLLPEIVVQDELRDISLVVVEKSSQLQECFYAITAPHYSRINVLEQLLTKSHSMLSE